MLGAAVLTLTLTAQFAELATSSGGRLGVCVQSIEGGEEAQELNGRERFPMQSVYKLPIAMAVLDAVDRKTLSLEAAVTLGPADMAGVRFHSPLRDRHPNGGVTLSVRELVRAAIVDSDGVASDALYRLAGGGARISSYIHMLGITDMAIATTEREMARDARVQYRNYATPCAAVALLRTLQSGGRLSTAARALLLRDLTDSGPGANRIKALLPAGTPVAHKTGTDATRDGLTRATNDAGIITLPDGRHLAIAVFVKDSKADEAAREHTIAAAARLAFDAWMVK